MRTGSTCCSSIRTRRSKRRRSSHSIRSSIDVETVARFARSTSSMTNARMCRDRSRPLAAWTPSGPGARSLARHGRTSARARAIKAPCGHQPGCDRSDMDMSGHTTRTPVVRMADAR
jgi:hypothetical protein